MPWAALATVLLIAGLDALLLGPAAPWRSILARIPSRHHLYAGVARDRVEIQDLRAAPPGRSRVLVLGSSRVRLGFDEAAAERVLPDAAIAKIGHARIDPFVIRALAPELARTRPEVVVIASSVYDTHGPVQIEPVPDNSAASVGAALELAAAVGPAAALRHRSSFLRVAGAAALRTYRFRRVLGFAGFDTPLTFRLDERFPQRSSAPGDEPTLYYRGTPRPVPPDLMERLAPYLNPRNRYRVVRQAGGIARLSRGDHVRVQQQLLRRAVGIFRGAGASVALVELEMHPAALPLRPDALREDFADFGRELAAADGVSFWPLERMPRLRAEDFRDLLHLRPSGRRELTAGIVQAIASARF